MTDDDKISIIALMIGDIPGGPYYPLFTEDQYRQFLAAARGDVNKATIYAAISAGYVVSGESSREVIGELQISNSTSANYIKLLDYLIATAGKVPPPAMMPWFAGADSCEKNKLLEFSLCDKKGQRPWNFTGEPQPTPPCSSGC